MRSVPERIQRCQVAHFSNADPEYGRGVAEGLGLSL
jgi:catalase